MLEEVTLHPSPAMSGAPSTAAYVDVDQRPAHALILMPSLPETKATLYPLARFILSWQVRWLRQAGIFVTLVMDDGIRATNVLDSQIAGEDEIDILTWDGLDMLSRMPPISGTEANTVVAMVGPLLINCDLSQLLASHRSSGRTVTAVRQRARARRPVAYISSPQYISTHWPELKSSLHNYSSQPDRELTFAAHCGVVHADCELLVRADRRELLRLESLWKTCAPRAGLIPVPDHPSAFQTGEGYPLLAPTARLRGPVILGANATVGDNTCIGPWTLLESNCSVSRRVWIEMAALGAGTKIEHESCVYASVTDPHTCVAARMPLLKAHLSSRHSSPQSLPSSPMTYELSLSYRIAKRSIDIIGAILALMLTVPVLCLTIALCLVAQGWPVLFIHQRRGLGGKQFGVFKLRTMRLNTDHGEYLHAIESSTRFKLDDDQRVTRLGRLLRRTSLDELPQLLNVLIGDMALVGPRPIVSKELMRRGVYASDLGRVKPGMTGLWQINGRSATTYARRIMLDSQYVDQCTLRLDLAILLHTLPAVILQRGSE